MRTSTQIALTEQIGFRVLPLVAQLIEGLRRIAPQSASVAPCLG